MLLFQNKDFMDDSSKVRSELSKDTNDECNDNKEMNKYASSRHQKQFEPNSDITNKVQNISSILLHFR